MACLQTSPAMASDALPTLLGSHPRRSPTAAAEAEDCATIAAATAPASPRKLLRRSAAPAALAILEEEPAANAFHVKNTFLECGTLSPRRSPSLEGFYREREVRTCPSKHIGRISAAISASAASASSTCASGRPLAASESPLSSPFAIQTPCGFFQSPRAFPYGADAALLVGSEFPAELGANAGFFPAAGHGASGLVLLPRRTPEGSGGGPPEGGARPPTPPSAGHGSAFVPFGGAPAAWSIVPPQHQQAPGQLLPAGERQPAPWVAAAAAEAATAALLAGAAAVASMSGCSGGAGYYDPGMYHQGYWPSAMPQASYPPAPHQRPVGGDFRQGPAVPSAAAPWAAQKTASPSNPEDREDSDDASRAAAQVLRLTEAIPPAAVAAATAVAAIYEAPSAEALPAGLAHYDDFLALPLPLPAAPVAPASGSPLAEAPGVLGAGSTSVAQAPPPPSQPPALAAIKVSTPPSSPPPPPAGFAPGSEELPSLGSSAHASGACKPCAFMYKKGCENGPSCKFCHLCGPEEIKRRRRERIELRRAAKATQNNDGGAAAAREEDSADE